MLGIVAPYTGREIETKRYCSRLVLPVEGEAEPSFPRIIKSEPPEGRFTHLDATLGRNNKNIAQPAQRKNALCGHFLFENRLV